MLTAQNNCTITVNRRTTTTKNSLGEPIYSSTALYNNIPVQITFKNSKTQYLESGERLIFNVKLIVDPKYILNNEDIVTNSIDTIIRKVVGIDTAFGPLNQIHHYVVMLLDP